MIAEVRERLAVSKQETRQFDVERFNLRKISEMEVRKPYQIKITNRIAVLENLNDSEGIYRAWQNSQDNIETSAKGSLCLCELKQHKPWFDEECLRFLDQRKQAKVQWVQDPKQSNVGNRNNVRREASRNLTLRLLMSYIYGAPILDVSRSHTTTQHSR